MGVRGRSGFGGALSGAAAGSALGPWGAAIGGTLGLIGGGMFGGQKPPDPWSVYKRLSRKMLPGYRREIKQSALQAQRQAGQSLTSRGLGGTTVRESVHGAIAGQRGKALARAPGDLMSQLVGGGTIGAMTPPMIETDWSSLAGLAAQMGKMMGQRGGGGGQGGWDWSSLGGVNKPQGGGWSFGRSRGRTPAAVLAQGMGW